MWMNLDQLPTGKSMYTLWVTLDRYGTPREEMSAEEVDVVASSQARSRDEILEGGTVHPTGEPAADYVREVYGESARVVGVTNQSEGFVFYDGFAEGDEG